jgi:hypothetical protein
MAGVELEHFYKAGADLAYAEFEKQAFIGSLLGAGVNAIKAIPGVSRVLSSKPMAIGKWLMGSAPGLNPGAFTRFHTNFVGMPLGGGLLGAAFAEEGDRWNQFGKGVLSGLAFMPAGAVASRLARGVASRSRLLGAPIAKNTVKQYKSNVTDPHNKFLAEQQKELTKKLQREPTEGFLDFAKRQRAVKKEFDLAAKNNLGSLEQTFGPLQSASIRTRNAWTSGVGTAGNIAGGIGGAIGAGALWDATMGSPPPFNPADLYR